MKSILLTFLIIIFVNAQENSLTSEACILLNKKDYKNAKIKLEQAVLNKECNGMFNLALLYINAHGVKQDYKKALKYFKQSLKHNCINSAYDIGAMYKNAEGVPRDIQMAKKYYLIASKNKYPLAQFELAKIYGNEKNMKKFIFWANKALENGYKPRTKNDKLIIEYLKNRKLNNKSKK